MRRRYTAPIEYEERVAGLLPRARREVASGAFSGDYDVNSSAKGDAPGWMVDCKQTEAKSFSVRLEDFNAIDERAGYDKIPAIWINFKPKDGKGKGENLVVLRESEVVEYARLLEGRA